MYDAVARYWFVVGAMCLVRIKHDSIAIAVIIIIDIIIHTVEHFGPDQIHMKQTKIMERRTTAERQLNRIESKNKYVR